MLRYIPGADFNLVDVGVAVRGHVDAMSQKQAQQVQQSLEEVQSLRQRLGTPDWREEAWGLGDGVWASYERQLQALLAAQITLKRLVTLVLGKRRRRNPSGSGPSSASEGAAPADRGDDDVCVGEEVQGVDARGESGDRSPQDNVKTPVKGGHRPGYGRLGADASAGADESSAVMRRWRRANSAQGVARDAYRA